MNSTQDDLRVGVVGVGHMGRHHVRIIAETPAVQLAGLHDTDLPRARELSFQYECPCFATLEELLDCTDAVTVAAPTSEHLSIGEKCLMASRHVMMEKPLADSLQSASRLVALAEEAGVTMMVGHVERYNPAVRKLIELLRSDDEDVISVDARRLAPFDGSRCLDVDVLYDLLIHDIDLALEVCNSPIERVSATGRPVFSTTTDVVHARIEFESRAVAIFWAGKCSPRKVRSLSVTTRSRYFEADTLSNCLTVHTAKELPALEQGICFMGEIQEATIPLADEEPLRAELEDFFSAIRGRRSPLVDGQRALQDIKALELVAQSIASGGIVMW